MDTNRGLRRIFILMKNFILLNRWVVFAILVFTVILIFLLVIFLKFNPQRTPDDTTGDVTPEKTTVEEVIKLNGNPISTKVINENTYLYYKTQSEDYKDAIVIGDNGVKFSIVNVFGSEKGFLNDYKKRYGEADMIMYDPDDEVISWNIFLDGGVGIATFNNNEIAKIVYFQPQGKNTFLKNIVSALGLRTERPVHGFE